MNQFSKKLYKDLYAFESMKNIYIVLLFSIIFLSIIVFAFSLSNNSSKTNLDYNITLERVFPELSFSQPVDLQTDNSNSSIIYIVEQKGIIKTISNSSGTPLSDVFLDISSKIISGGERGLLGLAFHPNFKKNGLFYVDYTAQPDGHTVIAQFAMQNGIASLNSEKIILEVLQPFSNHNAGQIMFGLDGYLYITLGDGGSGGDPNGNGQNPTTLLGSILRIDIDHPGLNTNYSIPFDNPFVNNSLGYKEEIYAFGLRNPWRMSQDPQTGKIWVGDVGQNKYEEIDIIDKGKNYGWNVMEGFSCYNPSTNCNKTGLQEPVFDYGRGDGDAVTGGYVYRGNISSLYGNYIFGDYGSGKIWLIDSNLNAIPLMDSGLVISSFGTDYYNNLFAFDYSQGAIYKFLSIPSNSSTITSESQINSSLTNSSKSVGGFPVLITLVSLVFIKKN